MVARSLAFQPHAKKKVRGTACGPHCSSVTVLSPQVQACATEMSMALNSKFVSNWRNSLYISSYMGTKTREFRQSLLPNCNRAMSLRADFRQKGMS